MGTNVNSSTYQNVYFNPVTNRIYVKDDFEINCFVLGRINEHSIYHLKM